MLFYLGTHRPVWLERTDVPLFLSRRTLCAYRDAPRAKGAWALDSGAFSELSMHGRWGISAKWYAEEVCRWRAEVAQLQWATIMDWMCEPFVPKKTGLSLAEHQRRTIKSYLELRDLAPEVPWLPVLQGWSPLDYFRHVDQYDQAGVELAKLPLVGLGSVCRRQGTEVVEGLVRHLHANGLRLHGFGFKLTGLRRAARYLASSDSMAWSFDARRSDPLPGCSHKSCANCMRYALWWRGKVLRAVTTSESQEQGVLF